MFERFRPNRRRDVEAPRQDTPPSGTTAVADRPEAPATDTGEHTVVRDRPATAPAAADAFTERREAQRAEFGGLDWPAAFFGWLVAIGIATLLVAVLGAAGAAIGITEMDSTSEVTAKADTIGIAGGVLLLVALLIAYYAGGYVAGRMARFDGLRQGVAVWFSALAVTVLLALAGLVLGSEYNVFEQLDLPRIPVDEGTLTTGGIIALAAVAIGTLLAAVLGGKAGERYHRRIDRF
jgi:hypothetical protein